MMRKAAECPKSTGAERGYCGAMDIQKTGEKERSRLMDQKIYKIMKGAGAANIAVGVITLVVGLVSGILLIVAGAKLLGGKSKILF